MSGIASRNWPGASSPGNAQLGPDHPDTGGRLNNLAELLATTKRTTEAEPYARRAVSVLERAFGPNHPDARAAADLLARIRSAS